MNDKTLKRRAIAAMSRIPATATRVLDRIEAREDARKHAQELGRLGGKVTSKAKTAAARKNAKLGGWPKGKKRANRNLSANCQPER